jgi:ATP-dependent DNA helicase RecG
MMLSASLLHTTDRYIAKLAEAGVRTVEDFVTLYPREHKDKANVITAFAQVNLKEPNTVRATLESMATERTRFGKQLVKAVIRDKHGTLAEAVWFNQPYLARQYRAGDEVMLYGKAKYGYGKLSFTSPDIGLAADASAIEPVYSDTNTIPGHWIASKMSLLRAHMREMPDLVPEAIRAKRGFPSRARALDMIHFPESAEDIETARRALAYEELYLIQAEHAKKRDLHTELTAGRTTSIPLDAERVKTILSYFPYELTDKQRIVTYQILRDMERDTAMYRLLQGDVGTGKTAVAFVTAIHAILGSGGQVVVLAPTEILARQHFAGFEPF